MRVVLITTKLNLETAGGSVVDLHLKAASLRCLGHDVTVVTAFSENNKPSQNLPYVLCEEFRKSRKLLAIQKSGYELLRKYESKADVFYIDGHIFCYGAGLYRLLGGKTPVVGFFNIKLTGWLPHGGLKARIRFLIERYVLILLARKLDAYIFTTPQVASLYRTHGFPEKRVHIIPDLADGGSHVPIPQKKVHSPIRFFASGRMIKEKGFELLLRAFEKTSDSILTISGDGPEAPYLKGLAEDLGIMSRVSFPGWVERDKLYRLMDESDVFVFPRWTIEYSSVLLIEAMMRSMPSIVPRGGGIEWLAGDSAVTFEDANQDSLTMAMRAYVENPHLAKELSHSARLKADEYKSTILGKKLAHVLSEATTS